MLLNGKHDLEDIPYWQAGYWTERRSTMAIEKDGGIDNDYDGGGGGADGGGSDCRTL